MYTYNVYRYICMIIYIYIYIYIERERDRAAEHPPASAQAANCVNHIFCAGGTDIESCAPPNDNYYYY